MPKYRYEGQEPCRVGTLEVKNGDTVDSSYSPGKRFALVEDPVVSGPQSIAQPLEPSPAEAPGKSRQKGSE